MAGEGSTDDMAGNDCLLMGNRFSASLIWRYRSPLFSGGKGLIFRPEYARVKCSYGADGGTRGGESDGCGARDGHENWCSTPDSRRDAGWCSGRPFRPEHLENMLRGWSESVTTYNEVILDAAVHEQGLPYSVEAILDDAWVHKRFIEHFRGLGYSLSEADVPLVSFDPGDGRTPFRARRNWLL